MEHVYRDAPSLGFNRIVQPHYRAAQCVYARWRVESLPPGTYAARTAAARAAFTASTLFSTALQSLLISAAPSERASSSPAPAPFDSDSIKPARWLTWPDQTGILFLSSQARAFATAGASFMPRLTGQALSTTA